MRKDPGLTAREEAQLANEVAQECIVACARCCKSVAMGPGGYMRCALAQIAPAEAPKECAIVQLQNAMRDLQCGKASPNPIKASQVNLPAIGALMRGEQPLDTALLAASNG